MFDFLILQGLVIDGGGRDSRIADIGVRNGKIEAIGNLGGSSATRTIEARGLAVAPGFVDIHTHSDITLLVDPRALSSLRQGVTTLVIGSCGLGCAPVVDSELIKWNIIGYRPTWGMNIDWRAFGEYLTRLQCASPSVNVVPQVSHAALRLAVVGAEERRASEEEIKAMRELLRKCLRDGARGLSTGLEYSPGASADLTELRALVAELGDGYYSTHVRSRNADRLAESVKEALATVDGSEAHLQISHLGPRFDMVPELFEQVLAGVNEAHENGIDVGFDTLVYDWGPHQLADVLPSDLRRGSLEKAVERLATPEYRRQIAENRRSSVQQLLSARRASTVKLTCAPHSVHWVGMSLQEIVEETGKDPFDLILDILLSEGTDFLSVSLSTPYTSDAFIERVLAEPLCVPMSDGMVVCADGPLKGFDFCRGSYGWAARFLDEYVGRRKMMSLEEGIRRLTSLPARCLGLKDRGLIQVGFVADIVILDPERVRDRSGDKSSPAYAEGVEYVLVNGKVAVDGGVETGVRAGCIL